MKHSYKVTGLLLLFFMLAQFIGLAIIYNYIDVSKSEETGQTEFRDLPIGERPPLEEKTSYIPIIITIIVGTILMLFLMKHRFMILWKVWFLLAVVLSLTVAFGAFIPVLFAGIGAVFFGFWKIFRPNFWVQNLTELFIYGGLAAIMVPLLNVLSVSILLVLIAIYDAYAVWKSKHMITLAQEQTKAKVFAGLVIPYELPKKTVSKVKKTSRTKTPAPIKVRTAILGGGDIGFPLIFAGVLLKEMGLWQSLVLPFFAMAGLAYLLWLGEKDKFYPAMPFIGAGCFVGLGVIWLVQYLL